MPEKHTCDSTRTGVEYWYTSPERYDGVSEWDCEHGRFGRWCGQPLEQDEIERRFCDGTKPHPRVVESDYQERVTADG